MSGSRDSVAMTQAESSAMLREIAKRTQETDARTREMYTMLAGTLAEPEKGLVSVVKEQGRRIGNIEKRQAREVKARRWVLVTFMTPIVLGAGAWIWGRISGSRVETKATETPRLEERQ